MTDISSIALSGLNDAVRRVSVAAGTIARAGAANNTPVNADGQPAATAPATTGSIKVNGVPLQDIGQADEGNITGSLLDLKQAEIGYKANLAVLRVDDRLQRELLNDFRV